jgi:hypothetical protein
MIFVTPETINPLNYLSQEEATKIAGIRLTSPPSQWDDEITQIFIRDHAYVPADQIVVSFKQKDDIDGYAIGNISFANMPHLNVPVVIKARELSPLDILIVNKNQGEEANEAVGDMTEDTVVPLTEENFAKSQDLTPIGQPMRDVDVQGVGFSEDGYNLRLPFRGRTVVAEHLGANDVKKAEFAKLLTKQACAGFLLNGTQEVVDKWLNAPSPKGLQSKVAEYNVSEAKIATTLPKEVDVANMLAGNVVVDDASTKIAVRVDVVDLGSAEKGTKTILVFEDGSYCNAPSKVACLDDGVPEDSKALEVVKKIAQAKLKKASYFMFKLGEHFTYPAKVASIAVREDQQAVTLQFENDLAQKYDVCLDKRIKVATRANGTWVLPMSTSVFEVSGFTTLPPMEISKVANWIDQQLPDSIVKSGEQYSLTVRGESLASQCSESKMASVLGTWISNGAELMKEVKEHGYVKFASEIPKTVADVVKTASTISTLPAAVKQIVADIGMDLGKAVKLAAALNDPQAVDSVLGTGFLTEDNIAEFSGLQHELEDTVSKLARLLLAIRMGFPGDESATVVAMKSLQRVKERLATSLPEN